MVKNLSDDGMDKAAEAGRRLAHEMKMIDKYGPKISDVMEQATKLLQKADIGSGLFHRGAHDGKISGQELVNALEKETGLKLPADFKKALIQAVPAPGADAKEALKAGEEFAKKLDTNHDGRVSMKELQALAAKSIPKQNDQASLNEARGK